MGRGCKGKRREMGLKFKEGVNIGNTKQGKYHEHKKKLKTHPLVKYLALGKKKGREGNWKKVNRGNA